MRYIIETWITRLKLRFVRKFRFRKCLQKLEEKENVDLEQYI